jgi:hypothetical protein
MNMVRKFIGLYAGLLLPFSTMSSHADGLPDASYSGSLQLNASGLLCTTGDSCTVDAPSVDKSIATTGSLFDNITAHSVDPGHPAPLASTAGGSIEITNNPSPGLFLDTSVSSALDNGAGVQSLLNASITYSLEIIGPSGFVPVKVIANGGSAITSVAPGASGNNSAFSFFEVGNMLIYDQVVASNSSNLSATFNDTNTYQDALMADTVYTVTLSSNLSSNVFGNSGGGTETLSTFVDPQFNVAATDPSLYTLEFSAGIGNSAGGAVPEPSTWALMLLGFAGIAWAARRRFAF